MLLGIEVCHFEQCQRTKKNSDSRPLAFSLAGSECRWHCSRAPMGSTVGVGGVDEPARSTDVFYGLALLLGSRGPLILTREDSGMRFAEPSCDPAMAICIRKNFVIIADIRGKVNALGSCRQTNITLISRVSLLLHHLTFVLLLNKCKIIGCKISVN